MKVLSCNSNRPLAEAIATYLNVSLTQADVRRFADMEVFVEIHENVRGEDVFVIQSTSYPANDNIMELLVCLDALRRGSARRVTAVLPYYGYARQDRKSGPRTPISAKLLANLITSAGADRILTIDLHAAQIQGFFDMPVDHLYASPCLLDRLRVVFEKELSNLQERTKELASDPVYSAMNNEEFLKVLQLRLDAAEITRRTTYAGFLHQGSRGYLERGSGQRRVREGMFFDILSPSTKHLRQWIKSLQNN